MILRIQSEEPIRLLDVQVWQGTAPSLTLIEFLAMNEVRVQVDEQEAEEVIEHLKALSNRVWRTK